MGSPSIPNPVMAAHPSCPALYGTPVIQKRVSIARPPGPPIEDSDVLVLNSRLTLPDASAVGAKVLCLDLRLSLPLSAAGCVRVNWAFAGLRETIPLDEEEEGAVRYRWEHTIDSHDNGAPDEGKMVQRTDEAGERIEVETGVGIDPETGTIGPYEEVWKSECIPVGAPFVFLMSHANPGQSIGFMAVLGPHAMGLWQLAVDKEASGTRRNELGHFHAVRLRVDARRGEGKLPTHSKVFSTGYWALDNQLGKLVEELLTREREGKRSWHRGERLILTDNSTWTVWDAGHVGN